MRPNDEVIMATIRTMLAWALMVTFVVLFGLLAIGCGATPTAPTAPVAQSAADGNVGVFSSLALTGAGSAKTCTAKVVWDSTIYGKVTVTNGATPCDYLFIVWDATVYENQINLAEVGHTYAPGETFALTLNYPIGCGKRYQRDLYVGVKPTNPQFTNRYTESDLRNYMYAASGIFAFGPSCTTPPPPPPPPPPTTRGIDPPPPTLCLDPTATNVGGSLPCVYPPPPPPPTGLWCHVAAVPSGITENTQSLPAEAIQNGHVGPGGLPTDAGYPHPNWRHPLDYPGTCDGRSLQVLQ